MTYNNLCFVVNRKRSNSYSLNVIVGALESDPTTRNINIFFVNRGEELAPTIKQALENYCKVLVGWSLHSSDFYESRNELDALKVHVDDSKTSHIAGGPHPTAEPEQTLRAGFNVVAVGEGEKTIVDFVSKMSNDEDWHNVKGVAYLDNDRYHSNGYGERIDLNNYPPFAPLHHRFNPIEITRGCMYACKFCQTPFIFKAKYRHRSVENICRYVKEMKKRGLTDIRFISPTSLSYGSSDTTVNLDKVEELLSSIRATLGEKGRIFFGTFPSEIRPEHVSRQALLIMKKYVNNDNIIIGGQSGSQHVLDYSHRGHRVEDTVSAVKTSIEVGFVPNVDFIFGLPGERYSDAQASLLLMEELVSMGARIHGHTFIPLPGTPFQNALPGRIGKTNLRKLRQLVARGELYGDWEKQISMARNIRQSIKDSEADREAKIS